MSVNINKCVQECVDKGAKTIKKSRVLEVVLILFCVFCVVIIIGIIGYRTLFKMSLIDSIYNTTLTVSTLGIAPGDKTDAEKIFTGVYAIIVGVIFISFVSAIVSYIFSLYVLQ
ncbi:hypothetical protein H012_gp746 [Acanthamoeba polyphaga moumouvirus]|uniref:Potassium channel protein n=1 Tax=Acanthamoeba polyphaga moumouvirus TaxID=1269028 RepID=L7RB94_9VIRU|nr:hypothetical protein H012_gp746 [Acanthamoeba polyphaga moumouvirus]AGC01719.1 hypothetical protein Moumou_00175 [Acanthamoeba polyphaga moumouvirus]